MTDHDGGDREDEFPMAGGWELPDGYPDPRDLTDGALIDEMGALAKHRDAETLTDEQDHYYEALRVEIMRRASVSGPYGDYDGPENGNENGTGNHENGNGDNGTEATQ